MVADASDVKRSESFHDGKKPRAGTGRILPRPPTHAPPPPPAGTSDSPVARTRGVRALRDPTPQQQEQENGTAVEIGDQEDDEMWRRDPRSADPSVDVDYFFQQRNGHAAPTGTARSGHGSQYDTYRSDSPLRGDSPTTSRSSVSMATNVLLGDTSEVIRAVRDRRQVLESSQSYSGRPSAREEKDPELDSENGSFFAIVDGHGHWRNSGDSPRPGYQKSVSYDAKESYTAALASAPVARTRADLSAVTKPLTAKPREGTFTVRKPGRQSSNSTDLDASLASEHSETESILSTSTDYSYSETQSPKMTRKGSGGKGPMSITRPNRAFQLRRAKADSDSESGGPARPGGAGRPTSAGSARSGVSSVLDSRKNRPSSARESVRSDASLGAAIVKRSRENAAPPGSISTKRADVARTGLRSVKQGSLTSAQTVRRSPDPRELRSKSATPKSMLGGGSGLAVTGVNKSQPNSRSNSPRSQEYSAWKKRKDYNPRQAVADAKATKTQQNKAQRVERAKSVGAAAAASAAHDDDRWRYPGRRETVSSMSSDADFDGSDMESERTDEITRISAELRNKVDAMAKSIHSDRAMGAADRSLVGIPRRTDRSKCSRRVPAAVVQ